MCKREKLTLLLRGVRFANTHESCPQSRRRHLEGEKRSVNLLCGRFRLLNSLSTVPIYSIELFQVIKVEIALK